jgi:hypothetical protein
VLSKIKLPYDLSPPVPAKESTKLSVCARALTARLTVMATLATAGKKTRKSDFVFISRSSNALFETKSRCFMSSRKSRETWFRAYGTIWNTTP